MKNKVPQGLVLALFLFVLPMLSWADNMLDAFELAIDNDPNLKAAQYARKALLEEHSQTLAKYFPTITLYSHVDKTAQDLKQVAFDNQPPAPSLLRTTTFSNINFGINLKQPIFNLANFRNRNVSEVKVIQAELNYRISQEDLIYRIAERYFAVLAAQDALNFARAEKNAIARQLKQTKERFKIGLTAVTDVHEAQARHDMALAQEIKAESELADVKEAMRRVTGKLHNRLAMLKADTPLIPPSPSNMNDWIDAARDQNLHIAQQKLEADLIVEKMGVTRAGHFPTLDFNASYGYNKYGGPFFTESLDAIISLDFNMTLFKGNIIASKIRQAQFKLDQKIQEIDAKEREILQQTRSAYLGILAGMSYVKALGQAMKSSEQALKATNAGFDVGTRTAIQVLDAQRELFRSQRDYSSARYEYILNMLRLKMAVGLLSIDDIEQINSWLQ
ncbi:MAG TPA: hypothetical protein ENJ28_10840 [Gammaproteobacteria bacterium]|nr:hypothetical protein [Gammaproteobacteria bacterium]